MPKKTRPKASATGVPNDAHLIGLVKSALARDERTRHLLRPRPNVSSCGFVVTLHGQVSGPDEADALCDVVGQVPGVEGVEDRLIVG